MPNYENCNFFSLLPKFTALRRFQGGRVRQGMAFEHRSSGISDGKQHLANGARFFIRAIVTTPVCSDADAGRKGQRSVYGPDDFGKGDLLWCASQAVSAALATMAGDNACSLEIE